jgi:DNA sulfur modification protein DndE
MTAPSRVTLSESTTNTLRQLASRTGLTPNLLARIALILSFEQRSAPAQDLGPSALTINRTSLFGDIEPFLVNAFRAVSKDVSDPSAAARLWSAHIARGSKYLQRRVNSIVDLAEVLIQ